MSRQTDTLPVAAMDGSRADHLAANNALLTLPPEGADPGAATGGRLTPAVYGALADAMLPRWRRVLAAAPGAMERKRADSQARAGFHATASALAAALWCRSRPDGADDPSLSGLIESALVGWQLSHRGDGRPRARSLCVSPLAAASAYHVALLLGECNRFQTKLVLEDLAAHLRWLASRRRLAPWIEARVVGALAEGGLLLRDRELISTAGRRAQAFSAGAAAWKASGEIGDLGLLAAALDPLARAYTLHQWEFLRPTLAWMGEILDAAIDRTGAIGGLRNVLRLPSPLPYGAETLARLGIRPPSLSARCRTAAARVDARALLSWGEDTVAAFGPSAAMCLTDGFADLAAHDWEHRPHSTWRVDQAAGLGIYNSLAYDAIVDARWGGALRLRWSQTAHCQEDLGVRAVYHNRSLTSQSCGQWHLVQREPPSLSIAGMLTVDTRRGPAGLAVAAEPNGRRLHAPRRWLGLIECGNRFTRRIRFEPTRVTITDSFRLRRCADLVLIGANGLEDHTTPSAGEKPSEHSTGAMVLEETMGATVTRTFEHGRLVRCTLTANEEREDLRGPRKRDLS